MFKDFTNSCLALLFIAISLLSCKQESEGRVLAEAYGQKLYLEDIQDALAEDMSFEDSVFVLREFINSWVGRQVVLHESELALTESERNKEEELKAYKEDLIVYETLNKLASEKMDSTFEEQELLSYYEDNLQEFVLSENIIKLSFVKLPQSLEDLDQLWSDFRDEKVDMKEFARMAMENGGNYFIDSSSWVYFDDILKEIPINTYNQEHFLNNNKNIRIKEGQWAYFVKIIDFRIKNYFLIRGTLIRIIKLNAFCLFLNISKYGNFMNVLNRNLIRRNKFELC